MAHIVFTMEDGSEVFADLNADIITVGRHPESMVMLPSGSVSGQHATIKRRADSFFVQDLGTTNGTRVNGVEVEEVKLEHGDYVSFGDVSGYFYATDEARAAEPEAVGHALPEPDAPVIAEPSVLLPERYSPIPRRTDKAGKTGAVGRGATRPIKQYKEPSGFGSFLFFILFLLFAFVVGLHVRHGQEHAGSILLMDVLEKYRGEAASKAEPPDVSPDTAAPAPAAKEDTTTPAPATEPGPAPVPAPAGSMMESGSAPSMMGQ